jgi:hypothetical protein
MLCLKRMGSEVLAQGPIVKATEYAARSLHRRRAGLRRGGARRRSQADMPPRRKRGYRDGVEQGKAEMASGSCRPWVSPRSTIRAWRKPSSRW